jgi:hypothetical protein
MAMQFQQQQEQQHRLPYAYAAAAVAVAVAVAAAAAASGGNNNGPPSSFTWSAIKTMDSSHFAIVAIDWAILHIDAKLARGCVDPNVLWGGDAMSRSFDS